VHFPIIRCPRPIEDNASVQRRRRSTTKRPGRLLVGLLVAGLGMNGCGFGKGRAASGDPVVQQAQAAVDSSLTSVRPYRGPPRGLPAQPRAPVVFVAADLSNGGVAGVARGVQEAARAIGWPFQVLDSRASAKGQRRALLAALRQKPGGIVLGGFDAAAQPAALSRARADGVPVVGWHAGTKPGPDPRHGLFTNVTTDPGRVARLAARFAIADSKGTASAVIFTDSEYDIATYKARVMQSELEHCRGCSVLQVVDTPIASATTTAPGLVNSLLQHWGSRFRYLLAINGAYIGAARDALFGEGRRPDQPPYSIAAGDGDASEFERIRARDYQTASVAEPLNLQGWQLVDELNRARAGERPSGYVAPPRLVTYDNVPAGLVFDPASGYRENYRRIWGR
jgi:ribose transport system substrate-binding protein